MKTEFLDYLTKIGISSSLTSRIEEIAYFYSKCINEELEDIFVTDIITQDNSRIYENLWFFSKSYIMEARSFISSNDFDCMNFNNLVKWDILSKEYDFAKATESSRLNIELSFAEKFEASFKASKENCDFLFNVFTKRIKQNL